MKKFELNKEELKEVNLAFGDKTGLSDYSLIKVTYSDGFIKEFDISQWLLLRAGIKKNLFDNKLCKVSVFKTAYKRSIPHEIGVKLSDSDIYKTTEVNPSLFKEWPLTADKVIIQKRGILTADKKISLKMIYLTVVINGDVIGLNGAAVDRYSLKSILDTKYYIKGLSVSELIDYGFNL